MRIHIFLGTALMLAMGVEAQAGNYTVTSIVTNSKDKHLTNPWGLSHLPKNHDAFNQWWVADNVSGFSTLYTASGDKVGLTVRIPSASGSGPGSPAGISNNPAAEEFVFATLDGTISAWNAYSTPVKPGKGCYECHVSDATIVVNNWGTGASYQGLTSATKGKTGALTYYAANANGGVEAYDATTFSRVDLPADAFKDSMIPTTYTPAGIQAIGSRIFVAYDASAGGGTGYVDAFDTNGKFSLRLENGWFDQPWGVAASPANFGTFSDMILVGNTGSGWIGAYDKTSGAFAGFLQSGGYDLTIPGLWAIEFGDGAGQSGPTSTLYFNAGGATQTTGEFGSITAQ
jgi:uncharacterized protein (TIGR03118 family)